MGNEWEKRLQRQKEFFQEGKGNFLIFVQYEEGCHGSTGDFLLIERAGRHYSEEYFQKHAYDLGVEQVKFRSKKLAARLAAGDDSLPGICAEWGAGATASLFTGGDVFFHEYTSYSTDTVIKNWDDVESLCFNPENRWVQYDIAFWRGVSSAYVEGIAVLPHFFRSPLDLAYALRGNQIYEDMYLYPEEVERLVNKCTEMIIAGDCYYRNEIPLFQQAPNGIWGVALHDSPVIGVNGDPVDLISPEMGERFNQPSIERLIKHAGNGNLYFHHHTLGVSRMNGIAKISGLMAQQFEPDMKCPRIYDLIDSDWTEGSKRVPVDIWQNILEAPDIDHVLDVMKGGRFIIHFQVRTLDESLRLLDKIRAK